MYWYTLLTIYLFLILVIKLFSVLCALNMSHGDNMSSIILTALFIAMRVVLETVDVQEMIIDFWDK